MLPKWKIILKATSRGVILLLPIYYGMICYISPFKLEAIYPLSAFVLLVLMNVLLIKMSVSASPENFNLILKSEQQLIWGVFSIFAIIMSMVVVYHAPGMGEMRGDAWEKAQWLGPFALVFYPMFAMSDFLDWLYNPVLILYLMLPIVILALLFFVIFNLVRYFESRKMLMASFVYHDGYSAVKMLVINLLNSCLISYVAIKLIIYFPHKVG